MKQLLWPTGLLVAGMCVVGAGSAGAAAAGPKAPRIEARHWIQADAAPDLRGRVAIVEFWTFGCINCVRTVPAMRALDASWPDSEVVVLGIHTPELDHERAAAGVRAAVADHDLRFPVALDNDFAIWKAWGNRYWPALYLVDRRGLIRHRHIGELHVGTPAWKDFVARVEALRAEP